MLRRLIEVCDCCSSNVLMMVDKKNVFGVLVIMGAGFVDPSGQRWRTTTEYSEYVHLYKSHTYRTH